MSLKSFEQLYAAVDQLETPVPVAAAGGADTTVIQALDLARRKGWVSPILTGDIQEIEERAKLLEIDLFPRNGRLRGRRQRPRQTRCWQWSDVGLSCSTSWFWPASGGRESQGHCHIYQTKTARTLGPRHPSRCSRLTCRPAQRSVLRVVIA